MTTQISRGDRESRFKGVGLGEVAGAAAAAGSFFLRDAFANNAEIIASNVSGGGCTLWVVREASVLIAQR